MLCGSVGLSATGYSCCRYCHKPRLLFWQTKWPVFIAGQVIGRLELWGGYDSICLQHTTALHHIETRTRVGKARRLLKRNGWSTKHVSPFWELTWMHEDFFKSFGLDLLHVEYLGLVQVLLSAPVVCLYSFICLLTYVARSDTWTTCALRMEERCGRF